MTTPPTRPPSSTSSASARISRCWRARVHGKPLVYFDNANTSQKPASVIEAMDRHYREHNANVARAVHQLGEEATAAYEGARDKLARFINAPSRNELILTSGTTQAINLVAYSYALPQLKPGDAILTTVMEHHANIVPWQLVAAAQRRHGQGRADQRARRADRRAVHRRCSRRR